jgi:hypothetical protein
MGMPTSAPIAAITNAFRRILVVIVASSMVAIHFQQFTLHSVPEPVKKA